MTELYLVQQNPTPSQCIPVDLGSRPHILCRNEMPYQSGIWSIIGKETFSEKQFCPPWKFESEDDVRKQLLFWKKQIRNSGIVVMNRDEVECIVEEMKQKDHWIDRFDDMPMKEINCWVMVYGFDWEWKVVPGDSQFNDTRVIVPPKEHMNEIDWNFHVINRGLHDAEDDEDFEKLIISRYHWNIMVGDFSKWADAGKLLEEFEKRGMKIPSPLKPQNIARTFVKNLATKERKNEQSGSCIEE